MSLDEGLGLGVGAAGLPLDDQGDGLDEVRPDELVQGTDD